MLYNHLNTCKNGFNGAFSLNTYPFFLFTVYPPLFKLDLPSPWMAPSMGDVRL